MSKRILNVCLLGGAMIVSGCSSIKTENALNGEQEFTSATKIATVGAATGAGIGAAVGGGAGALIGAGVGAAVGGVYGQSLDETREQLKDELNEYGITVVDNDGITVVSIDNSLLFKKSSPELREHEIKALNKFIEIVSGLDDKGAIIKVVGHTDNTGKLAFNISLSEQRAKNVAFYMFKHGLPAHSIEYTGAADLEPIVPNDNENNRALNRRVEISIIPSQIKY